MAVRDCQAHPPIYFLAIRFPDDLSFNGSPPNLFVSEPNLLPNPICFRTCLSPQPSISFSAIKPWPTPKARFWWSQPSPPSTSAASILSFSS